MFIFVILFKNLRQYVLLLGRSRNKVVVGEPVAG